MSTLPMNFTEQSAPQRRAPKKVSNASRQARMQKQLGAALLRDSGFEMVLKYALVWMLLIAMVAGFAETYASHDKFYLYNLDVPRKLL